MQLTRRINAATLQKSIPWFVGKMQPIAIWARARTQRLWTMFPMIGILAIALGSIGMQELLPDEWPKILLGLLVLSCSVSLLGWFRKRGYSPLWTMASVLVGIGMFVSQLHSNTQKETQRRLQEWEGMIERTSLGSDPSQIGVWKPFACRATIESGLRYRKANLPGGSRDPNVVGWQTMTVLRVESVRVGGRWINQSMLVPFTIDGKVHGLYPGDAVEILGQWRLPIKPSNPGQFDQAKRFAELGYAATAKTDSESQVTQREGSQWWRVDRLLAVVSASALTAMERYVILGQTELTAALVLGQREQAEWRLQEELLATGTIHMLSISGMHIEMVALSLLLIGIYFYLPRKILLVGVCTVVLGYALLCGTNPPVVRATMMLIGLSIAKWNGWNFSSLNYLAFSGVCLILFRTSVVFETGTQLSFLAVAVLISSAGGIVSRQRPLQRLMQSKSSKSRKAGRQVRAWSIEMLRTSFWVWFITAPLVWNSFHVISPIAIVLNLLLWLPMLLALMAGLGLIAFGWMPFVAWPLGIVCGFCLWIVDVMVGFGVRVPFGHFWMRAPPEWWLYGFYLIGIGTAMISGVKRSHNRRRVLWLLGGWFVFGLCLQPSLDLCRRFRPSQSAKLCMTFLDVGHGTCILIETPDHQNWLYDAGRLGDHQRSYQVMAEAMWHLNVPGIDCAILSHADSDHFNGFEGIVQRFRVSKLLTTTQVLKHDSPLLKKNLEGLRERGTKIVPWSKGDQHQGRDWSVLAVHPPTQGVEGTDNANSLCVLIEFAGRRILLPGDLEPPGMQLLVASDKTKVDLMMAPHHGSLSARTDSLLRWCSPGSVVISGGNRAMSARVIESLEGDGRRVFVTARDDAIRVEIDSKGAIQTMHWNRHRWETLPER
jgi:competence protein ComEC